MTTSGAKRPLESHPGRSVSKRTDDAPKEQIAKEKAERAACVGRELLTDSQAFPSIAPMPALLISFVAAGSTFESKPS
jgi:hypothetical protein